jgi:hypothetical protein
LNIGCKESKTNCKQYFLSFLALGGEHIVHETEIIICSQKLGWSNWKRKCGFGWINQLDHVHQRKASSSTKENATIATEISTKHGLCDYRAHRSDGPCI